MTNSHCIFRHHPSFISELDNFINKHCLPEASSEQTLRYIQNLLQKHFFGNSGPMLSDKHLGTAQGYGAYSVYWLHLVIPNGGLSRTQYPKVYFYNERNIFSFLCLDSHIKNYKDSKLRKIAQRRLIEILEVLKTMEK